MKKKVILILALALLVFFSGCVQQPISEEAAPPAKSTGIGEVTMVVTPKTEEAEEFSETYDFTERNLEHNWGLFETKLLKTGFFTHEVNNEAVTEFRVDIWVRNAGKETSEFMQGKAYVEKISVGKYPTSGGTFDGKDVAIGEEREGYLLFNTTPEDISGDVVIVIGNSVGFSTIFDTITQAPHRYEIVIQ